MRASDRKTITIELGGVSRDSSKVFWSGVDLTLLICDVLCVCVCVRAVLGRLTFTLPGTYCEIISKHILLCN